jgi:hypothetical protein
VHPHLVHTVGVRVEVHPERLVRRLLREVRDEREHAGEGLPAEPDVDEVRALRQLDAQQHVAQRGGGRAGRDAPHDPRGEPGDAVAQPVEDRAQQGVVLEAVAAAAAVDELGRDGVGGDVDGSRPVSGSRFSNGMVRVWAATTSRSARSGVARSTPRSSRYAAAEVVTVLVMVPEPVTSTRLQVKDQRSRAPRSAHARRWE